MTDEEIQEIMYMHANCFTNYICFTDQGVLDFARALLDQAGYKAPTPEPEPVGATYADAMWRFVEGVDNLQGK
jgi:hypothetical protein